MSELFFDGYSEYELQALKIPTDTRGKCVKQLANFLLCREKAGPYSYILTKSCEDEQARFDRCHQRSVNYYTASTIGVMRQNNPALFDELKVSPTYEQNFTVPTPLYIQR